MEEICSSWFPQSLRVIWSGIEMTLNHDVFSYMPIAEDVNTKKADGAIISDVNLQPP